MFTQRSLMIIVYSSDWDTHLTHLPSIFVALHSQSLFAKIFKCEFCYSELGYLGYMVYVTGGVIDPDKVQAIKDWPLPTNIKGLQGFLNSKSYYQKFVASYSTLAALLTQLLCKIPFVWTSQATTAFDDLKKPLSSIQVLALPSFTKKFIVQMDASGLGMVLS